MNANPKPARVDAIDVVRGMTLFLMLFVNDLFMPGVPAWMGHTAADYDGMGLADWVFPSFLFMVGMSVPYALAARRKRGEGTGRIFAHILFRTASLILIGVALLNTGRLNAELTGMSRTAWTLGFYLSLFLFWNNYPRSSRHAALFSLLRGLGGAGIVVLLALFRSGTAEAPQWLVPGWWGILGLIGWGYFAAACVSLFTRGRLVPALVAWALFLLLNILSSASLTGFFAPLNPVLGTLLQGNVPMIVLTGLCVGTLLHRGAATASVKVRIVAAAGVLSLGGGFLLREWFIVSKILATPSWGLICNGVSLLLFAAVYWWMDVKGHKRGMGFFRMAGRNSMTTYIAPSVVYTLIWAAGANILCYKQAEHAWLAIAGSLLWSWAMVWFSALLMRMRIQLKL